MNILLEEARAETVIKNSRFIAEAFPVSSQAQAREMLHSVKRRYADSSHVVHAFVTGAKAETCGMSDDGEPGGTAGRPVLDVLKGSGITNILLTVTRYFGGTLLGTGGLVHAYSGSARLVLESCRTEPYAEKCSFSFASDYGTYQAIKRIFSSYAVSGLQEHFGAEISVSGEIVSSEKDDFVSRIKNISKGKVQCI